MDVEKNTPEFEGKKFKELMQMFRILFFDRGALLSHLALPTFSPTTHHCHCHSCEETVPKPAHLCPAAANSAQEVRLLWHRSEEWSRSYRGIHRVCCIFFVVLYTRCRCCWITSHLDTNRGGNTCSCAHRDSVLNAEMAGGVVPIRSIKIVYKKVSYVISFAEEKYLVFTSKKEGGKLVGVYNYPTNSLVCQYRVSNRFSEVAFHFTSGFLLLRIIYFWIILPFLLQHRQFILLFVLHYWECWFYSFWDYSFLWSSLFSAWVALCEIKMQHALQHKHGSENAAYFIKILYSFYLSCWLVEL